MNTTAEIKMPVVGKTTGTSNDKSNNADFTDLQLRQQALDAAGPIMLPVCMGLKSTHTREAQHNICQWFREPVSNPLNLPKADAPYLLRSTELQGQRSGAKAYAGFQLLGWDVDRGGVSLDRIQELCEPFFGSAIWCAYSTSSARQGHMRSRVLALTAEPWSLGRWADWQHAVSLYLSIQDIELDDTACNPNQLVGLPNVPQIIVGKIGEFIAIGRHAVGTIDPFSGKDLSGTPIVWDHRVFGTQLLSENCTSDLAKHWLDQARAKLAEAAQAAELARMERAARRAELLKDPALDAIGRWKADPANDIELILEKCGYEQHPYKLDSWRSPLQKSSSYAVKVFSDGKWHSYSGSDMVAGIGKESPSGGRFGDAFDAWVFHFKNNRPDIALAELHNQANVGAAFTGLVDTRTPAEIVAANRASLPAWAQRADVPSGLNPDGKGNFAASKHNLMTALLADGFCFGVAFDEFLGEVMVQQPSAQHWRPIREDDYFNAARCLEASKFRNISTASLREAILAAAREKAFDSAKDWLNALPAWDGVDRVSLFLEQAFGVAQNEYHTSISKYVWTALAGRVLAPGVKADMVIVASGRQGAGKSSVVKAISPFETGFGELNLGNTEADLFREMRGCLVMELPELSGIRKRESEDLKRFVASTTNVWVDKYHSTKTVYPRRCIFVGTTNETAILNDPSGSRRWLPFECGSCNPQWVIDNRDHLWAQGAAMFKANGVLFADAERLARDVHDDFRSSDPWEGLIERWITAAGFGGVSPRQDRVLTADVLQGIGLRTDQLNRAAEMRVGECLKRLGYERKKHRINGVPRWAFSKGGGDFQI